jgi:transposase-like protein
MPWKEHRKMSLKMEFVEKASRPGARVSELCREYGVSRETGYKWLNRFKREGYHGLEERSRAPHSSPLMKAEELVAAVLSAREAHPRWGPKKLHVVVKRRFGEETPSQSTIARILRRFGQVKAKRARRPLSAVERAPQVVAEAPNDVWTVDFKGWWRSLDGNRCEPLTIRDAFSRCLLVVELLDSTAEAGVREFSNGSSASMACRVRSSAITARRSLPFEAAGGCRVFRPGGSHWESRSCVPGWPHRRTTVPTSECTPT